MKKYKIYNAYFELQELTTPVINNYRELVGNDDYSIEEIINVINVTMQYIKEESDAIELITASPLAIGMFKKPTEDMIYALIRYWGDHFVQLLGKINNNGIIQSLINLDVQLLMYVSNNVNCTLMEPQANKIVEYLESDDRDKEFNLEVLINIFSHSKNEPWYCSIMDIYKLAEI